MTKKQDSLSAMDTLLLNDFYSDEMTSRIFADRRKYKKRQKSRRNERKRSKEVALLQFQRCKFFKNHPDISIGFSKFCDLRPSDICF